jgi:Holliday junction resolvase RusA-like endonuclease
VSALTFFVAGVPVPQGSKTGYSRGGSVQLVDSNAKVLKPWRAEVTRVAFHSWLGRMPFEGPVRVYAVFVFEKPKTVKREAPSVRPDIDKLARALLDGVTDAKTIWRDDAQVTQLDVEKTYGAAPGVHVVISRAEPRPAQGQLVLPIDDAA